MPHCNDIRHDWSRSEIDALYNLPFMELLEAAHKVHRANFDVNAVQISTLLSVKTGSCPEDCAYCPQSGHYHTDITPEKLLPLDLVLAHAQVAKERGASRFCMGAAWRHLPDKALPEITAMIQSVKALGLETCVTLGMLNAPQCVALKSAGLDYYNHNLDTSPEYYSEIITTRTYQDRLDTLAKVQEAGIKVCCGGIVGLGEEESDRIGLLAALSQLNPHPQSVPINQLIPIKGTPLENTKPLDCFDFIRTIAVARILMPKAMVRLSAGRESMSDEMQAWCFFAGANSIFYGEKLLTSGNPKMHQDDQLFQRLGLHAMTEDAMCSELECQ